MGRQAPVAAVGMACRLRQNHTMTAAFPNVIARQVSCLTMRYASWRLLLTAWHTACGKVAIAASDCDTILCNLTKCIECHI